MGVIVTTSFLLLVAMHLLLATSSFLLLVVQNEWVILNEALKIGFFRWVSFIKKGSE